MKYKQLNIVLPYETTVGEIERFNEIALTVFNCYVDLRKSQVPQPIKEPKIYGELLDCDGRKLSFQQFADLVGAIAVYQDENTDGPRSTYELIDYIEWHEPCFLPPNRNISKFEDPDPYDVDAWNEIYTRNPGDFK